MDFTLTQLEQVLLAAVIQFGTEGGYGLEVYDTAVQIGSENLVKIGSLYSTLDRLERRGFMTSWFGEPDPERGGKPRRYFRIEASGARALKQSLALTSQHVARLQAALEGA